MKIIILLAWFVPMVAVSSLPSSAEAGLTGLWQHPDEPVIIDMQPANDKQQQDTSISRKNYFP